MKVSCILLLLSAAALAAPALAQNELPSAPSAVKQPPPPAPPPPTPQPDPSKANAPAGSKTEAQPALKDAASPPAAPASETKSEGPELETIRKRVDEVNVVFTVTDKRKRFVKNLSEFDFKVMDDGRPPQSLVHFRRETDLPLRVALLVDASSSVRERFKFEQEASIEFFSQIIRRKFDKAMVVGFDSTSEVTQDFTDQTELLGKGVQMLRPGGGTALYDALYFACRDKLAKTDAGLTVRRAVVLLSDGEDNQSHSTREEAIEMALRAEVVVYAISTNVSSGARPGDKELERIAEATGGRVFFPFHIEDVANYFSEIQDELRSQYAIAYKPAAFAFDGRFRTIDISTLDKKFKVRSRKGYYAPAQ
ncbi:MAG TPA: VWA domain-containing protein [Terriglobales bacterium]|nr:VWA domain-containing protein [Terriglobales bacterium]